jgi:transcriptional regulator with XRE-family HTH domain
MGARIECIDDLELQAATEDPDAVAESLRKRLADELEASRDRPGAPRLRQEDIAAITGKDQTTVSRYLRALSLPDLEFLRRYEEYLGLPRGTFAARAGYVAQLHTLPDAITTTPELNPDDRDSLLDAYDAMSSAESPARGDPFDGTET